MNAETFIRYVVVITILFIKASLAVNLPCEFDFNSVNGYTCTVVNFTNTKEDAYITKVIGEHLYKSDENYRNRSNESVVRVIMWNANITYLPGNLTVVFPLLRMLLVKKCGMKGLTRATEFHTLRKIFFGFNEIDRVPVNYFWHFCKLEMLSLYANRISEIPKMAFRDLISLKRLSLNSNRLKRLAPDLFDNCTNLEYVDLDNNFLTSIDGRLFANLTKLTRIYLRNNQIRSIGDDFLADVTNLQFALLQNNTCIDESFPEMPLTASPNLNPLEHIQSVFKRDCTPPVEITTSTIAPRTTKPRKKQKYQPQKIYYFEDCKWHASAPGHRYY